MPFQWCFDFFPSCLFHFAKVVFLFDLFQSNSKLLRSLLRSKSAGIYRVWCVFIGVSSLQEVHLPLLLSPAQYTFSDAVIRFLLRSATCYR